MNPAQEKQKTIFIALIALGLVASVVEAYLGLKRAPSSHNVMSIWLFACVVLVAYWAVTDARQRQVEGPYTRGFLMYFFWFAMIPAYFIKVNGSRGWLLALGFFLAIAFPEAIWLALDSL